MERKITELEQKLLDDGWVLTEKHYTGNHSEENHINIHPCSAFPLYLPLLKLFTSSSYE